MTQRRPPRIIERGDVDRNSKPVDIQRSETLADPIRRPRAIEVSTVRIEEDAFAAKQLPIAPPPQQRRTFSWLALAGSAFLGLIGLAVGLWVERLVGELFALSPVAGIVGLALVAILALGLAIAAIREFLALRRLGTWQEVRTLAERAKLERDEKAARTVERDLLKLFADRPDLAAGRRRVGDASDDVLDAADRIALLDAALLKPLDERAMGLVLASAKRVSVVTAVAPRALIDVAFVLIESARLIRRVAELYGMRPGKLGFVRLCRDVIGHLAVTGAIAVGDSIVGEALGHSVASKVSRRFGEGMLNGLMTLRIGISAMDLCRPLPFAEGHRPNVGQLTKRLVRSVPEANAEHAESSR